MHEKPKQSPCSRNFDFDLYKILIEEMRRLHRTWIDNYRVILTFNSLLLPGSFAIFIFVQKGQVASSSLVNAYLLLMNLSIIGAIVTIVGIFMIRRTKAISSLRQNQVRRLEETFVKDISVAPFLEGYLLFGGILNSETMNNASHAIRPPKPLSFSRINSFWGYNLISMA